MDRAEEQTLDRFCEASRLLDPATSVTIVAAAADELDRLHRSGAVHGRITPSRLARVGRTGARIIRVETGPVSEAADVRREEASYLAPEQVRGEPADARSDLFALGIVLFEMLTGRRPFEGDSLPSILYRIVNDPPADIAALRPDLPFALRSLITRALAKDPSQRFADAREFAGALRASIGEIERRGGKVVATTPHAPAGREGARHRVERRALGRRVWPYATGAAFLLILAGVVLFRPGREAAAPEEGTTFEARVRTEPPGIPLTLDGEPFTGERLRFPARGPFGVIEARQDCRRTSHRVSLADAGGEIVLVLDPSHESLIVDPGVSGATVHLNGTVVGSAPATVTLDLCRENRVEIEARGFYSASAALPAGTLPAQARAAIADLRLRPAPPGRLILPAAPSAVRFLVNGRRVQRREGGVEVPAGRNTVRAVSEEHWVDASETVDVPSGETVKAPLHVPPMAELLIQTFPPNCKVYLRRGGEPWRFLDDTPIRREIAPGRYGIRVESPTSRVRKETEIVLESGANPPVRVALDGGAAK